MGAEFSKPVTLVKCKDGQTIILNDEDTIEQDQTITLTCDSPKCRQSKEQTPTRIVFEAQQVQKDPLALPDSFSHSVKMFPDPHTDLALWFCCAQCTKDYLTYTYVPPKTARERMEEVKRTQEAMQAMQQQKAAHMNCTCGAYLTSPDCPVHSVGIGAGRG